MENREIVNVDLSEGDELAARQLRRGCLKDGFFYLKGHGVEEELIKAVFEEARKFFALPLETKMMLSTSTNRNNRGYTRMGEETLDPESQSSGDTKEGYYIGVEESESDALSETPFHGPNLWPSEELLPQWRDVMMAYHNRMVRLGRRMCPVVSRALGLPPAYFDGYFVQPIAILRLLRYSEAKSEPHLGVFGAGAHTDYGMLTFLRTDQQPGLQIRPRGCDDWVNVPPMNEAFIVNVGDMLQRWTNDLFLSTPHRVVSTSGQERFSVPFFYDPGYHSEIRCVETCVSGENPARYPPVIAGEHIMEMYEKTHADFEP